jgi:hypothetical protein
VLSISVPISLRVTAKCVLSVKHQCDLLVLELQQSAC